MRRRVPPRIAWLAALALAAGPAAAATFTVGGPNGQFASVQAGIDAALAAAPGEHEVRVIGDFFSANPNIFLTAGRSVHVRGGWNADFSVQTGQTTLFGGGTASTLRVTGTAGEIEFSRFIIVGGAGGSQGGGGIRIGLGGDARMTVRDSSIAFNTAIAGGASTGNGGGLFVLLNQTASLMLYNNQVGFNLTEAANAGAFGGGLWAQVQDSARLYAFDNRFVDNITRSNSGHDGSAVSISFRNRAFLDLTGNHYRNNRFEGTTTLEANAGTVSLLALQTSVPPENCIAYVENSIFADNNAGASGIGPYFQLKFEALPGSLCQMLAISSLLSDSDGGGVLARNHSALPASRIHLSHLTLPDTATQSLDLAVTVPGALGGVITLYNSVYLGTHAFVGNVDRGANAFGVTPASVFWAPARRDYRPRPGSDLVDLGLDPPPGGLGLRVDLDGFDRVVGKGPDLGAYESGYRMFYNGFQ